LESSDVKEKEKHCERGDKDEDGIPTRGRHFPRMKAPTRGSQSRRDETVKIPISDPNHKARLEGSRKAVTRMTARLAATHPASGRQPRYRGRSIAPSPLRASRRYSPPVRVAYAVGPQISTNLVFRGDWPLPGARPRRPSPSLCVPCPAELDGLEDDAAYGPRAHPGCHARVGRITAGYKRASIALRRRPEWIPPKEDWRENDFAVSQRLRTFSASAYGQPPDRL
jgi:hypothetical protein